MTSRVVEDFFDGLRMANPWMHDTPKEGEFNDHGWLSDENQEQLDKLIEQRRIDGRPIKTVIELGSWLGKSTRFLAKRVELVIAIDHWKGSREHRGRKDVKHLLPGLYRQFLWNCRDLSGAIAPLRMDTTTAAMLPLPLAEMVYVDASHDYADVCQDLLSYERKLAQGGILCGDDWLWGDGSVAKAVTHFARLKRRAVYTNGNFWWLGDAAWGEPG